MSDRPIQERHIPTAECVPLFPVRIVYLAPDGSEMLDTFFDSLCVAVPRIGETVIPQAGSQKAIVQNVYHRFIATEGKGVVQFITVCVRDFPS